MLEAGKLNRRVTILERFETQNDFGEEVPSFRARETIWAASKPIAGREQLAAGRLNPTQDMVFIIRYAEGRIQTDWRLLYEGTEFEILAFNEIGNHEGLSVTARARA